LHVMACNAFYNLYQLHFILNKPFIFTLSSVIKPEKIIYSIVVKMILDSENPIPNQKNKGGRLLKTIWENINQGQSVISNKFSVACDISFRIVEHPFELNGGYDPPTREILAGQIL